jgi:hypothetical protein
VKDDLFDPVSPDFTGRKAGSPQIFPNRKIPNLLIGTLPPHPYLCGQIKPRVLFNEAKNKNKE